jgi:hypothetical protein
MRAPIVSLLFLSLGIRPAIASLDNNLVAMAPPQSTVLVGIDVGRASSSDSGNYVLRQVITDPGFARIANFVRLNVGRDVKQILTIGVGQQSAPDAPYAVVAQGSFDPARLVAAGQTRGATVQRFRGYSVLVASGGNGETGLAFPQSGFLVMGDLATVEAVLSSIGSGGPSALLRQQIEQIGPANDLWYATVLSGPFLVRQMGDALPEQLRNSGLWDRIKRSDGGLRFGHTDQITANLVASSPADAGLISGLLHVAGGLSRLPVGGDPNTALAESVLRSMQVTAEGSVVSLTAGMPDAELARTIASANK